MFAPFGERRAAEALRAARFSRYALFGPHRRGRERQVLLRFDDGAPLLVEARRSARAGCSC